MKISLEELTRITEGKLQGNSKVKRIQGFEFDSRNIDEGKVFIPLKGRRDGHQFIKDALSKGGCGTLSEIPVRIPPGKFSILVDNTFEAFKKIARHRRNSFRGTTIGITGSVGKTTTKELLNTLLSPFFNTYRNIKSFNNLLGITYTLSNIPPQAELYIQEIGTNRKGEVEELRKFISPDIAVVTAVEKAHTENFIQFEELIEEKLSITQGVPVSIVPEKFKEIAKSEEVITFGRAGKIKLKQLTLKPDRAEFSLDVYGKHVHFQSPVPGIATVNATMITCGIALLLSVPLEELPPLLESFTPPEMRMEIKKIKGKVVINDSYNANPTSMKNAIEVLSLQPKPRLAIVGEMLELGKLAEEEHRKIGIALNRADVNTLISYGKLTRETAEAFNGKKFHFTDREELINFIKNYDFPENSILIKGSRGNRLEEIYKIIEERFSS